MAFAIDAFGLGMRVSLGWLPLCVHATCFMFGVLNLVAYASGFSLWWFLVSSVARSYSLRARARPDRRCRACSCGGSRPAADVPSSASCLPTGYAFHVDGTCISPRMAAIFIAQAVGVPLTLHDQLVLLGVLPLTSGSAASVTGAGLTTPIATLGALNGKVPGQGVALVVGRKRFLSEARAITDVIGNGVVSRASRAGKGCATTRRCRPRSPPAPTTTCRRPRQQSARTAST